MDISDQLRAIAKNWKTSNSKKNCKNIVKKITRTKIKEYTPDLDNDLSIYLVLGVNGVGKTTSIAKLTAMYEKRRYICFISSSRYV